MDDYGSFLGREKGCQKAVNFLTKYYGIRRMKIVLNGRKVGNGDIAVHFQNSAYFTKRGLDRLTVLHELYHHNGLEQREKEEEKRADSYARRFTQRFV